MNFTPLTAAGITGNEAAHLFKVSRVSVAKWLRKDKPTNPHPQIEARVAKVLAAVAAAVAAGALPLASGAERVEVKPRVFIRPGVVAAVKAHLA